MDYETRSRILEEKRKIALSGQEAARYVALCEETGYIDEQGEDLYQRGMAELGIGERVGESKLEKSTKGTITSVDITNSNKYDAFYDSASRLSDLPLDVAPGAKSSLLRKCFRKFGNGGSQDLSTRNYSPSEIGKIFNQMFEYAKERTGN
jgi:Flp pilus assembly protein TadG